MYFLNIITKKRGLLVIDVKPPHQHIWWMMLQVSINCYDYIPKLNPHYKDNHNLLHRIYVQAFTKLGPYHHHSYFLEPIPNTNNITVALPLHAVLHEWMNHLAVLSTIPWCCWFVRRSTLILMKSIALTTYHSTVYGFVIFDMLASIPL